MYHVNILLTCSIAIGQKARGKKGFLALTSFTILTMLKTLHGFMQTIETESIATYTQCLVEYVSKIP